MQNLEPQLLGEEKELLLARFALIGVKVLIKDFNLSTRQASQWLDKTLAQIEEKYAIYVKEPTDIQ